MFTHRCSLRKKVDDCPSEFKVISQRWRQQQGSRHKDIENFAHTAFGDTKHDLMQVMTTIKYIPIQDKVRDTIYKIINNGLYIRLVAHTYQTTKS